MTIKELKELNPIDVKEIYVDIFSQVSHDYLKEVETALTSVSPSFENSEVCYDGEIDDFDSNLEEEYDKGWNDGFAEGYNTARSEGVI